MMSTERQLTAMEKAEVLREALAEMGVLVTITEAFELLLADVVEQIKTR